VEICSSERLCKDFRKLAELKDSGIDIYFFVGNHDLWMKDYLEEEIGIPVFLKNNIMKFLGKTSS
jgi:UDP-2,3-diacylglucosamine hydrolase